MNQQTSDLAAALSQAASLAQPARVPDDLWRQGRRRHRKRRLVQVIAAILGTLAMVPVVTSPSGDPVAPATGDSAGGGIPARVHQPYPWQAAAKQHPNGRSAMLVSGSGLGYASPEVPWTYGTKIATVGRNGSYRMLRFGTVDLRAGQDVILSPSGEFALAEASLEDFLGLDELTGSSGPTLKVTDLTTGLTRGVLGAGDPKATALYPVGWSPDGTWTLVLNRKESPYAGESPGWPKGSLWLCDQIGREAHKLIDLPDAGLPVGSPVAAFSPDGKTIAVQYGTSLVLVDFITAARRTLTELPAGTTLAGRTAWTPDGGAVALLTGPQPAGSAPAGSTRLSLIDARSGKPLPTSFDAIPGGTARLAGWQADGTAVVVRHLPPSAVDLVALAPGGGSRHLFDGVQHGVTDLDLASDLVAAGAFGGPAPAPAAWPAAPWGNLTLGLVGIGLLAVVLVVLRLRRGRRRLAGAGSAGPPGGSVG